MNANDALHIVTLLIDYFETGNNETDSVAKLILESDSRNDDYWQPRIKQFRDSLQWTGIRAVEAELLAVGLRDIKTRLEESG